MEVLKFGFSYWKKYFKKALGVQFVSFIALTADLLLPLLSSIFINYIILSNDPADENGNIFKFLLTGNFGEVHTLKLFFSVAAVFMTFILIRLVLVYFKNIANQKLGLALETDLRIATFKKLM